MCESFGILCALCRIGLYALYRRICCKGPSPVRPNFTILCIGLENAGKSSILATLSEDDFHKIEPTIGFSIKAVLFEDCILDVKELGGGDMVRPYWERYYQTFQGIIFVIDSSSNEEKLTLAKTELYKAIQHHQLKGIPLMILATGKEKENARSTNELSTFLGADQAFSGRQWLLKETTLEDKETLSDIFSQYNQILINNLNDEIEKRNNSPQHSSNRL